MNKFLNIISDNKTMKKILKFSFIIFFSFLIKSHDSFCQTNDLIKTTEYTGTKKRREMILNKEMDIVEENYYSFKTQQIVNTLYYEHNGKLRRIIGYTNYPKITFDIDLRNGTYEIPENKTLLKFNKWFNFEGLQKGDNILVNYSNGIRQGRLIQTDSAVYGSKTVVYQRPNVALLNRFNILKFYNEIGEEDTYKVYKGLILNFKSNQLNGRQLGYYASGSSKLKAIFKNGKVINYYSYSEDGNTLSNIVTDTNAIVKKPYIVNGIIEKEKVNISFTNNLLQNTGLINFKNDFSEIDEFKFKQETYRLDNEGIGKFVEFNGVDRTFEGIIREVFFEPYVSVTKKGEYSTTTQHFDTYLRGCGGDCYGEPEKVYPFNFYALFTKKQPSLKKLFDEKKIPIIGNNPHVLRILFGIPFFTINRFDFENKDQSDLEIIDNKINTDKVSTENQNASSSNNKEFEEFYNSILEAIKYKTPEYKLLTRLEFDNWINNPIDMNELYAISNKSWAGLKNKNSSLGVKQESLVQFAKIYTLILKNINKKGTSSIQENEMTELGMASLLNMGHSFLVLGNYYGEEFFIKSALSFYSKVPLDYNFKLFDNASTESIIQNDWKELIKNNMLEKSITKNVDLKNLPKD